MDKELSEKQKNRLELTEEAKKYVSDNGYGPGTNLTTSTVVALITNFTYFVLEQQEENLTDDIYQILGKYGEDREDIKSEFRRLCTILKPNKEDTPLQKNRRYWRTWTDDMNNRLKTIDPEIGKALNDYLKTLGAKPPKKDRFKQPEEKSKKKITVKTGTRKTTMNRADVKRAVLKVVKARSEPKEKECGECLQPITQEEYNMFGGLHEDCSGTFDN